MRRNYKRLIVSLICSTVFTIAISLPALAIEPPTNWEGPTITIPELMMNASNWAISVVAFVSIFIIVIAGFMWSLAYGDAEKVSTARKWITGSITGLVIALASWALVRVVLVYFFRNP